jgi:pre-60S factor REI1
MTVDADADDDEIAQTIDAKIAAARARLAPSDCLFCAHASSSLEENLLHMSGMHSFFVPDTDYLVDAPGLLAYLGEKVAVGNVCLYCNGRGREFRTLDAVRKHMVDKGHCKLAYDTQRDQLEISDYYDFRASYPDAAPRKSRKLRRPTAVPDAEEWEDIEDDDGSADEVVDASASESGTSDDEDGDADEDDADALPESGITYGDSHYELVLPSGARIGHRSLKRYYAQSFPGAPRGGAPEDPASGAALVRRLLKDKTSALVPRRGGFGAFGAGTDVVKARNRGEAREAGRHMREFRDVNRKEQYKTRVAYQNNYQKHYRDPLLQVRARALQIAYMLTARCSDTMLRSRSVLLMAGRPPWVVNSCGPPCTQCIVDQSDVQGATLIRAMEYVYYLKGISSMEGLIECSQRACFVPARSSSSQPAALRKRMLPPPAREPL